jgi:hypothetical protein
MSIFVLYVQQCRHRFNLIFSYKTWSFTFNEEHKLRVFKNRVLSNILGLGGRKLQETGENYIMTSFIICIFHQTLVKIVESRRMRWSACVAHAGQKRNARKVLVGKSEERRPLARPRHRWYDIIKVTLA